MTGVAGSSRVFPASSRRGAGVRPLGVPTLTRLLVCLSQFPLQLLLLLNGWALPEAAGTLFWRGSLALSNPAHTATHDPGPLEGAQTPLIFPKAGDSGSLPALRAASPPAGQALGPPCS